MSKNHYKYLIDFENYYIVSYSCNSNMQKYVCSTKVTKCAVALDITQWQI